MKKLMLEDLLGQPHDVAVKILKSRKREIWKYNKIRTNAYAVKITLDNDIVVGIE